MRELKITKMENKGKLCRVTVELPNEHILEQMGKESINVYLTDPRPLEITQNKKIFALIREVTNWYESLDERDGMLFISNCEEMREILTLNFIHAYELIGEYIPMFSLSPNSPIKASISVARQFIDYLIGFCIKWNVPTNQPLEGYANNIGSYVYACMANKVCCVTRKNECIETHHVTAVGMGNNRSKMVHIGMLAITLSAELHREAHTIGNTAFFEKYHIEPIKLSRYLVEKLKLGKLEFAD